MKKLFLLSIVLFLVAIPIAAQDEPEPIPVSGTFDYTSERLHQATADGKVFIYAREDEVWSGSFEGTGDAIYTATVYERGEMDIWLQTTITGTVLGEYEGTVVLLLVGNRPISSEMEVRGEWFGDWAILSGTDDLEHVYGQGIWWGQGGRAPEGVPNIYYTGEIVVFDK